jgi:hypothetical protein
MDASILTGKRTCMENMIPQGRKKVKGAPNILLQRGKLARRVVTVL